MKPWELLEPDVDLGIKIGLRKVITRWVPCELLAMEVVLGTNIGLSKGITYVVLGLYVLPALMSTQA